MEHLAFSPAKKLQSCQPACSAFTVTVWTVTPSGTHSGMGKARQGPEIQRVAVEAWCKTVPRLIRGVCRGKECRVGQPVVETAGTQMLFAGRKPAVPGRLPGAICLPAAVKGCTWEPLMSPAAAGGPEASLNQAVSYCPSLSPARQASRAQLVLTTSQEGIAWYVYIRPSGRMAGWGHSRVWLRPQTILCRLAECGDRCSLTRCKGETHLACHMTALEEHAHTCLQPASGLGASTHSHLRQKAEHTTRRCTGTPATGA